MIKDQSVALREVKKQNASTIKMRFENVRDTYGKIVVVVEQNAPLSMALVPPTGMMTGVYVPGRVPGNPHDHREMKKDWFVIRTHAKADEVIRDPWPPEGVPILVLVEGIGVPKMGTLIQHLREFPGGKKQIDSVFVEYVDPNHVSERTVAVPIQVQDPATGSLAQHTFHPHDMNSVIAWSYLSVDNQLIPPKRDAMLELFVDCEFEDSTKTLLSMALVTRGGQVYYAFDSEAADKVKEKWVQDNVLTVLLDVPPNTHVIDLMRKYQDPDYPIKTFSDFVKWVITLETNNSWLDPEVTIHADFPTDIGYVAPLFHLGNGERIRPMTRLNFVVDYVDSFPTGLKDAVQHNAAWDALAMWLHMGYTAYIDPRRLANSSIGKESGK